jgi:hypothetical protein
MTLMPTFEIWHLKLSPFHHQGSPCLALIRKQPLSRTLKSGAHSKKDALVVVKGEHAPFTILTVPTCEVFRQQLSSSKPVQAASWVVTIWVRAYT